MLAHEWRELEVLCERISTLRSRLVAAQKTKNSGLVEGIKDDLMRARRHREMLVHHISARLGSAAADDMAPSAPLPPLSEAADDEAEIFAICEFPEVPGK